MKPVWIQMLSIAVLALTGCATAPKPLQGEFASLSPEEAGQNGRVGERVRWGGEIVAVETLATRSCFELLGKPLGDSARPSRRDESSGRFLACRDGFYDPALFEVGRDLTVIGSIEAIEPRRIGEFDYRYPRLAAEVIYLWPQREPYAVYPMHFWGGYYADPWLRVRAPIYRAPYRQSRP